MSDLTTLLRVKHKEMVIDLNKHKQFNKDLECIHDFTVGLTMNGLDLDVNVDIDNYTNAQFILFNEAYLDGEVFSFDMYSKVQDIRTKLRTL